MNHSDDTPLRPAYGDQCLWITARVVTGPANGCKGRSVSYTVPNTVEGVWQALGKLIALAALPATFTAQDEVVRLARLEITFHGYREVRFTLPGEDPQS